MTDQEIITKARHAAFDITLKLRAKEAFTELDATIYTDLRQLMALLAENDKSSQGDF